MQKKNPFCDFLNDQKERRFGIGLWPKFRGTNSRQMAPAKRRTILYKSTRIEDKVLACCFNVSDLGEGGSKQMVTGNLLKLNQITADHHSRNSGYQSEQATLFGGSS